MRTKRAMALGGLLMLGLLLPSAGTTHPVTVLGSLSITGAAGTALDPEKLVGFALIANPGLEKTIVQQLPPFTLPIVIDGETAGGPSSSGLVRRNLDTTLVLTNTTAEPLTVELTIWDASATDPPLYGPTSMTLGAHQTKLILLSDLLLLP